MPKFFLSLQIMLLNLIIFYPITVFTESPCHIKAGFVTKPRDIPFSMDDKGLTAKYDNISLSSDHFKQAQQDINLRPSQKTFFEFTLLKILDFCAGYNDHREEPSKDDNPKLLPN